MSPGRARLLVMIPQAPPFGGVAAQASLLLSSRAFERSFEQIVIRTNTIRRLENPERKKLDLRSAAGAAKLALATAGAVLAGGYDAVYCTANGDLSFPWVVSCALHAARLRRCPLILHVHASRSGFWEWQKQLASGLPVRVSRLRSALSRAGDRLCAAQSRKADRIVHLTKGIDEHYGALGWRRADAIVPNGTRIPAQIAGGRPGPGELLFLGRLSREKGFFDLLEALSGPVPGDWRLHVAGSVPAGEDPASVESALAAGGIRDRVLLHGLVTGSAKSALLSACSVLVHPTHRDVFPMSVVEAMASGMAVVACAKGEIPSMPAEGGWIEAAPGDPSSLRKAILRLLEDPAAAASMGEANRKKAMEEYEVEANSARIASLILTAVEERR